MAIIRTTRIAILATIILAKGARKKKLKMLSSSTVPKDNTSSVTPVKTEVQTSTGDGGEEDTPAFELAPLMS